MKQLAFYFYFSSYTLTCTCDTHMGGEMSTQGFLDEEYLVPKRELPIAVVISFFRCLVTFSIALYEKITSASLVSFFLASI